MESVGGMAGMHHPGREGNHNGHPLGRPRGDRVLGAHVGWRQSEGIIDRASRILGNDGSARKILGRKFATFSTSKRTSIQPCCFSMEAPSVQMDCGSLAFFWVACLGKKQCWARRWMFG